MTTITTTYDPKEWKLVPVEPTKEMLWAITPASALLSEWKQNYASILSAAPTVPHLESADKVIHDACQSLMPAVQVPQKSDSKPIGEIEARKIEDR